MCNFSCLKARSESQHQQHPAPGRRGGGCIPESDTEPETRGGNHEGAGEEDLSLHEPCLHKQQKQCSQTFINVILMILFHVIMLLLH